MAHEAEPLISPTTGTPLYSQSALLYFVILLSGPALTPGLLPRLTQSPQPLSGPKTPSPCSSVKSSGCQLVNVYGISSMVSTHMFSSLIHVTSFLATIDSCVKRIFLCNRIFPSWSWCVILYGIYSQLRIMQLTIELLNELCYPPSGDQRRATPQSSLQICSAVRDSSTSICWLGISSVYLIVIAVSVDQGKKNDGGLFYDLTFVQITLESKHGDIISTFETTSIYRVRMRTYHVIHVFHPEYSYSSSNFLTGRTRWQPRFTVGRWQG